MKKQFRLGFTLVELLVVISIIGMLAGLLLPAVNAAREAGRRAVCMNNQSQLALAIINYDSARNSVPPLRGEIGRRATNTNSADDEVNVTSWVGFLLPYMEYSQLYQNLSNVRVIDINVTTTGNAALDYNKQLIRIKSLLCPSSDPPQTDLAPCHYVANGGYQNAVGSVWDGTTALITTCAASSGSRAFDPGKVSDAVFFDHRAGTNDYSTTAAYNCTTKCSIDYISSHSGTSNVILVSENERAISYNPTPTDRSFGTGHQWAYWDNKINSSQCLVNATGESRVGFCFPINIAAGATVANVAARTELRLADYTNTNANWSYRGYAVTVEDPSTITAYSIETPVWINAARGDAYSGMKEYRRARPASNHPGIVLAAFADRSVRPVLDTIDKETFVWLCQPNSGNVVVEP